MVFEETSTII